MVWDIWTMVALFIVVPAIMAAAFVIAAWIFHSGDDE